jgi:hypothetical protein
MISAAEAPSVSGDELPGVMCQLISGKRRASSSVRAEGGQQRGQACLRRRGPDGLVGPVLMNRAVRGGDVNPDDFVVEVTGGRGRGGPLV